MLYKYCNTNGFDILKNSRLRLSRINSFNDPFELMLRVDEYNTFINTNKEYKENPNIINDWVDTLSIHEITFNEASPEDILKKFNKFRIDCYNRHLKTIRDGWNKTTGITCLSESMDVIQMWAHYTDNHKGIVVGIEECEFLEDQEAIVTVCYRDKPVLLSVADRIEENEEYGTAYFHEVLGRKETNWSYEKEIRLFGELNEEEADGYYYTDIPSSSIKEIYLGLRSDSKTELIASDIKNRDEYKHLKIFKMTKDKDVYKLTPKEIKV
jgi:hypothetical protein